MSSQDNVFLRTTLLVLGGILVFMFVAIFIANMLASKDISGDPMVKAAIEERIKPVGQVHVGAASAASAGGAVDAKAIYQSACFACHGTGAAGAPKTGDKAAWKARISQGTSTLYKHAVDGFKGMPAKGGRGDLSNKAVKAVVDYMVTQSK